MDRFAEMKAFIRVVDAGSFSSAARQLLVGQPAVSKTIAQLEDRLGVRLLLRSTRGLVPTEAGRSFYDRAKRAIEEAAEAELAARGTAATLSGRLRVCAAVTFARLHVVPRLPAFLAKHPALDVDVLLSDGEIDLIEAGIDVALRISPLRNSSLTGRKIAHCHRHVVGTPAFFKAYRRPQIPADLMARQAIIYEVHERRLGSPTWTFRQGTAERSVTLVSQNDDRILGFTMIGSDAGEVMAAMQTAILAELPYQKLRDSAIAHLTVAEGFGPLLSNVPPRP